MCKRVSKLSKLPYPNYVQDARTCKQHSDLHHGPWRLKTSSFNIWTLSQGLYEISSKIPYVSESAAYKLVFILAK